MNPFNTAFYQLCQSNSDVMDIINTYKEIEQIYREAQEAMGIAPKSLSFETRRSTDANILFSHGSSTSTKVWNK